VAEPLERPDLLVVSRFLERLWRERQPMKKTTLQLGVRLNYNVFRKYLDWLVEKGFVSISPHEIESDRVSLTAKGEEAYGTLVKWIRDTLGTES
jgi:predicted transcriptional regulator